MRLSKSQFVRGLQCMKSLWLLKNKPGLRTPPNAALEAVFNTGTDVGILAQQLFPGGVELAFDFKKINKNIQETQKLIKEGVKTIYEATFLYDDVLVMVDILHHGRSGWELYEVKSSTSLKSVNKNDISVQYYVVKGSGLPLSKASLIHINNKYCRNGNIDLHELFSFVDITDIVISKQDFVATEVSKMKTNVGQDTSQPNVDIGPHCSDPYECDFSNYCWGHIPEKSIFNLDRMRSQKKFELYNQGIITFSDIPDNISLTKFQSMQVDAELKGSSFIDITGIKEFVETLKEPVGFLDFETFQQAVPEFNNQCPYEQVPFQYSLHVKQNGELKHTEYLGKPGKDPRERLLNQLINDTRGVETILVYNMGFEKRILKSLGKTFPEYEKKISEIIDRISDLMTPFQKKAYYVASMEGSYSIKKVLPALVPELNYNELDIADGMTASRSYLAMAGMADAQSIKKTKEDLLKYCRLDTLAMVEILNKLKSLMPDCYTKKRM